MDKVKSVLFTALDWVKAHKKQVIAVLVVIVVLLLGYNLFSGKAKAKRAVKSYVSAINKANASKLLKLTDIKGMMAWEECNEDADDFKDEYKDVDDDEVEEYEDKMEEYYEYLIDSLEDYSKYTMKVEKIKSVKNEGSGVYKVTAKIKTTTKDDDGDTDTNTSTSVFYIYKGKLIGFGNGDD